jgi:hypothetical protein
MPGPAHVPTPYIAVGGEVIPSWNVVLPVEITVGRSDPSSQPDANALTFTLYGTTMPAGLVRGARVAVRLTGSTPDVWEDVWDDVWEGEYATGDASRFYGHVADLDVTADIPAGRLQANVTCIGRLAEFGDQIIGDQPFPVETDAERAARISALVHDAGAPFVAEGSAAVRVLGRDVDRRRALELLHAQASSTGAVLWEYADGTVHYAGFDHRVRPTAPVVIPAASIIGDATWSQTTDQMVDRARVEYGVDLSGVARAEYVAGTGDHEARLSGELADLPSATTIGNLIVHRWGGSSLWDAPLVSVRSDLLDQATYDALLSVGPGDAIHTIGLADSPHVPGPDGAVWFVEGYRERWERLVHGGPLIHFLDFAVSSVERFLVDGADVPMTLSVTPAAWTVGDVSTPISVVVTRDDVQVMPDGGIITILVDGMSPIYALPAPGPPYGSQLWYVYRNMFPPGVHKWRAAYSGIPGVYRPNMTNEVTTTVTTSSYTFLTLTAPTTNPNLGDYLTLIVDLFDATNGTPQGMVYFESSTNYGAGGNTWSRRAGVPAPGGDTGARVGWSWHVDTTVETWWRANFVPAVGTTGWRQGLSNILGTAPITAPTVEDTP